MIKVREPSRATYGPNLEGRDFIVGDIHGCYEQFMHELDLVDFDVAVDRCFSVGDLIDRGPDSATCLWLSKVPWFIPVYGNHEDLFLQAVAGKDHYMDLVWHQNGGDWAKQESKEDLADLLKIAKTLPYFITLNHRSGKKVGICHAQAPTTDWNDINALTDNELQAAIWGRTVADGKSPKGYYVKNVDLTVHGHTPTRDRNPMRVGNSLFIDTGAVYRYTGYDSNGNMTIINLDEYLEEEL